MGRQRKRDRLAAASRDHSGGLPTRTRPPERVGSTPQRSTSPVQDPAWRKAERRRVLLLGVLPGPPQRLAARGTAGLIAATVLQTLVVLVVGLLIARVVSGQWLPSYAGLLVLGVAVALQYVSRAVNSRRSL